MYHKVDLFIPGFLCLQITMRILLFEKKEEREVIVFVSQLGHSLP